MEDKYVSDAQNADSAPTEYRTVKVALMYPSSLRRKYNEEHLNSSIGGVENFLLLNGNIVSDFNLYQLIHKTRSYCLKLYITIYFLL